MRRTVLVLVAASLAAAVTAAAFTPADPLASKQWYLQDDHAFDAWPEPPTTLQPVKVAIVDSGVDCSLPDLQGRIPDMTAPLESVTIPEIPASTLAYR